MCGILAVISNRTISDIDKIKQCGEYLQRRGTDSRNCIINEKGIFIFYRLAVNDLSVEGDQPFVNGNVLMMCNGDIYNNRQLEEEYELKCRSSNDCEVIIKLYKKLGFVETVKKLYGVYSILLVDGDNIYLARDKLGIRPLYFGVTHDKCLAVSSVPNTLIDICEQIFHFPPGVVAVHNISSLQNSTTNVKILEYLYQDKISIPETRLNQITCNFILKESLINSIKYRLNSDRPIGVLLSGGINSSVITSILCRFLGSKNVRTYSIGFKDSTDLLYSKKVSEFLGTTHTEVIITPDEAFNAIPEVINCLSSYDIATVRKSIGMYLICKYIKEHTNDKVIFSGEGLDELLCGHLYFHNTPNDEKAEEESIRLLNNIHFYDILRADRCISSNNLNLRLPYLDHNFVNIALSLNVTEKLPQNGYEKYIFRKVFEDYLPKEVIWRHKEDFSDGISSNEKPLYKYIQEMVDCKISEEIFNNHYPSKEAYYYKLVFDKLFPTYNIKIPYWLPKWTNTNDPSGRLISIPN
jgi:asparagine synthase (glutamine-hydrolysing)